MTREQIEKTYLGIEISRLSNASRYGTINKYRSQIENEFNVKIEEYPFTALPEIPMTWFYLSATDSFRNISLILVFKPKD